MGLDLGVTMLMSWAVWYLPSVAAAGSAAHLLVLVAALHESR